MLHDPHGQINDRLAPIGFPLNIIIELETMTIVDQRIGEDARFFDSFEARF